MTRTATIYKRTDPPKSMRADSTVSLAMPDDDTRPVLQHVHTENGYRISTDGFRLHAEKCRAKTCPICKKEKQEFPNWQAIIPTKAKYSAVIDARELRAAIVRAGIFAREGNAVVKFTVNGKAEISAKSEGVGESQEVVHVVKSEGEELTFGLNYKFAIDALDHVAPNGGVIELRANYPNSPVLLRGKDRIAVVMPMCLQ